MLKSIGSLQGGGLMTGLQQRLVYILVAINVAMHIGDLPHWIPTLGIIFVLWRWLADVLNLWCPGRAGTAVIGALVSGGIYLEFNRLIGDPASTAILLLMISLKTLEVRFYRDIMAVTYLCLLLLMSKLLNSQSMSMAIFMFVDLTLILALMHLYHMPNPGRGIPWRRAARLIVLATPILVVLFGLFPRFNISLFQRGQKDGAQVGFSGRVRPGDVSKLARSDEIAFRAFFRSGFRPPISRLYWRGAVLDRGEGLTWDPGNRKVPARRRLPTDDQVEIMIQGEGAAWLFTLDWPSGVVMSSSIRQQDLLEGTGLTFALRSPIGNRETYSVSYLSSARMAEWDENEAATSLEVSEPTEELKSVLNGWKEVIGKSDAAIGKIRSYFIENKFAYTLTPPPARTMDEFLLRTRRGFCEHFSGTTATLLRHLKIPARLVVGYQGGAPSMMGDYWIVYQRDAHAWVEYWDEVKKSWMRLDPTAWVAEERVALGGQGFFERTAGPSEEGILATALNQWFGPNFVKMLMRSRLIFDQAEIYWITYLLRYDFNFQKSIMAKLGWDQVTRGGLFLISMAAIILMGFIMSFWARRRDRSRRGIGSRMDFELTRRLKGFGLNRAPNEGPLQYFERAFKKWPHAESELGELFALAMGVRYGDLKMSDAQLIEFRRRLRRLNVNSVQQH